MCVNTRISNEEKVEVKKRKSGLEAVRYEKNSKSIYVINLYDGIGCV